MQRIKMRHLLWLVLFSPLCSASQTEPEEINYVPNKQVALKIADAVLTQIYGRETINREKPLTARLVGNFWIIRGNLPANLKGGEAEIKLSRKTGEILYVTHDK